MKLTSQKRLAAHVMKVGKSRVWIDPEFEDETSLAITKEDIRIHCQTFRQGPMDDEDTPNAS
jgi:ribosomal protein L19E